MNELMGNLHSLFTVFFCKFWETTKKMALTIRQQENINQTMDELFNELPNNTDPSKLSQKHNLLFSFVKERERTQKEQLLSSLLSLSSLPHHSKYPLTKEEVLSIELIKVLINKVMELQTWAFLPHFPRSQFNNEDISKFKSTVEKLNSFATSKTISYAGPIVRSLSPLFFLCTPFIRSLLLLKFVLFIFLLFTYQKLIGSIK